MLKNIRIKIVCLLMSFLVFIYVRYEAEGNKEYQIDVEIRNIPSGLAILESDGLETLVNIKVFKDKYIALPEKIVAFIDLTNAKVGKNNYDIELDFDMNKNTRLTTSIKPRKINLTLEETLSKNVNIIPDIIGKTNENAQLSGISINPKTVTIYGPQSLVSKISNISISQINISNINSNYTMSKYLILPKYITANINTAKVNILFTENIVSNTYTNINININNLQSQFRVEIDGGYKIEYVVLEGIENTITNIKYTNIKAYLDLSNINEAGTYNEVPIKLSIPENVNVVKMNPSSLTITAKEND